MKIPFNKPSIIGNELAYIKEAVASGKISGNGLFTKKCQVHFTEQLNTKKCLLTTSCTDAIEMSAILSEVGPGDEVILPSYTFVSTANPFLLRGANVILSDSYPNHPNIDPASIKSLITNKT
ncbi:MAG: DegT/DnrJ/EryC1/StrS family aminotransferase, partial [Bacteroidota bacterium]